MQEGGTGSEAVSDQRTWRGYAQIALVVVVLAAALYFARAPGFREPPGDVVPAAVSELPVVDVVVPKPIEQSLTVNLTGSVSLEETTTVVSEVEGRIAWVSPNFTNGGSIAAGEMLLRVDPAEFELAVEEAQAVVEAAEARVWIEEALGAENEREFALENPDAEPSEWVRRLPNIALAQAELKKAQAVLKRAELRLERTNISLPYDVRVMTADASVGEWASPEESVRAARLGVVYHPDALQVKVPIEPRDLAYLEPALGRFVRVTGRMGAWEGEISGVSSIVNPTSRLTSVFIDFAADESMDALPPPGTFVEISIEGPAFADVYVLPNTVLQSDNSIWIVRDGKLHLFQPEAYGWTADGWVVKEFDAGAGVVTGTLPGAHEGLEVSTQAASEAN